MPEHLAPRTTVSAQSEPADSSRTRSYNQTRRILSVTSFGLDLVVLGSLLMAGWSILLRDYAYHVSANPGLALLVYLALIGSITKIIGLPVGFISGYWLEDRYGLSSQNLGAWIWDELKGLALGAVLAGLALEFLYWILRRSPDHWWLVAGAVFILFFVLMANLAPVLIFPIFFKFKPLENPGLAERLVRMSERAGTRVRGVFEWKLSEKSTKANAALMGLGNTRRIIVADTLLGKFSDDEVEAVLAHELGHHVHRHIFRGLAVQTIAVFLGFYVINLALVRFDSGFGFRGLDDFANLPLVVLVSMGVSLVLLPAVNAHSRQMERQADAYALGAIADRSAFISSMEKLADLNLAERQPNRWIEFFFYSHPSIGKRIAFAQTTNEGRC